MELYSALRQSAERHTDMPALQWETGTLTYTQLLNAVNTIGNALRGKAAGRRHIALLSPNTPNFVFGLYGILGAGHIAVPLNPLLKPEEMVQLVNHGETRLFLYDPLMKAAAEQVAAQAAFPLEIVSIPDWLQAHAGQTAPLEPGIDPDEVAMILYTSGTTGDPKGVMLSHKNLHSNYTSFSSIFHFSTEDTFICILPLFHSFAMTGILLGGLLSGSKVLLFPQFLPQKVVEALVREQRVILMAVPPMLHMIAHFSSEEVARGHNLRYIVSGGGPLPKETFQYFLAKVNHEILEGYGLTETSPVVAHNHPGRIKVGTIGHPMPGVEVQVRDDAGNLLGPDQVGELCVRGDLVMKGYYKNPQATEAVFYEGGWLRTGDLASIDTEGFIRIAGRCKDLIVCGGENIYPREIEETLLRLPGVLEAAVVARPHRLRSEVPHAFVTLRPEAQGQITESDLRKHSRLHLAEYKIPEAFEVLEQMPKTAKGTVKKEALRARFAAERK